jgi:methylmalonyl-CoA/ethylmalonyl-CoA epimerase
MIFDHIGVFVRSLEDGQRHLSALLPITGWSGITDDPLINVRVQFGTDASGLRYELVAPLGPGSPVDTALATGDNLLNHVAYRTATLDAEVARMRRQRCIPTGPARPAVAFGGRRVIFLLTPLRFIVELVEDPTPAPA